MANKVQQYLSSTGEGEEVKGFNVIPSNPEQSKHLETATMRLFGLYIDFVNLRCEDYSENSGIPTMKFGTPEEDAYRRDLTINSLFYNIHTNLVEDFTNRGMEDLKFGRIVTPLRPKTTFLDDPLRILRAIRFAARFDFTLDEELKEAAAWDDVKRALEAKISRERIGSEIDGMISGNQPVKAIDYICDLTLFWVVFKLPPKVVVEPAVPEDCDRLSAAFVDATLKLIELIKCPSFNTEKRRLSLYSALFLPLRLATYTDKNAKRIPAAEYIFKDSLKQKDRDAQTVINVHKSLEKFISLIPSLLSNDDSLLNKLDWARELLHTPVAPKLPVVTGFVLKEIKDYWQVALLMSTLLCPTDIEHFQLDKKKDLFVSVDNAIVKLGLEKVWDLKPLVNGKDIMNLLQLKDEWRPVGQAQRSALAWQLANPSGTSEECLDRMREHIQSL